MTRVFILLQYVLPQQMLSRIIGWLARCEARWFKNFLIGAFVRNYPVRMEEAVQPDALAYSSFNTFFTRALRPELRPQAPMPAVISPVDGTISQIGAIDGHELIQAKGHKFSLSQLLTGDEQLAPTFEGGTFTTIYLAPFNYHRIHMALDGALLGTTHVPGRLFSVNTATAAAVPQLFARNERVTCVFETPAGLVAVILVGALFVGSMETVWAGEITKTRRRVAGRLEAPRSALFLKRGDELGRFNMGSTVILLFERGRVRWDPALGAGSTVQMGQAIGTLLAAKP